MIHKTRARREGAAAKRAPLAGVAVQAGKHGRRPRPLARLEVGRLGPCRNDDVCATALRAGWRPEVTPRACGVVAILHVLNRRRSDDRSASTTRGKNETGPTPRILPGGAGPSRVTRL